MSVLCGCITKMNSPLETNQQSAGVNREEGGKSLFLRITLGGGGELQADSGNLVPLCHQDRIFIPDAVTSQVRGPLAVTRGGGGKGEGEGAVLARRRGVRE